MDGSVSQEVHYYSTRPAETKDDRTPTGSSVVVENMRARLSLVTLTPSAVPRTIDTSFARYSIYARTTRTQRNTQGELVDIRGWYRYSMAERR